jgi:membrane protease YdiL (CAAX protease family)
MWSFIAIDFVTLSSSASSALFSSLKADHRPFIVIQAAGGAIAATTDDTDVFNLGCHIMLAGIILQLITTLVFLVVFGVYYHRFRKYRGDCLSIRKGSGVVFWGVCAIAALILIRFVGSLFFLYQRPT